MKEIKSPPPVPLYWANHALELEKKLRGMMKWDSATVRQRIQLASIQTYFASNPPWEVIVEVVINNMTVWNATGQFPDDEGQSGYDRVLKSIWQRFNDDVLTMGIEAWRQMKS